MNNEKWVYLSSENFSSILTICDNTDTFFPTSPLVFDSSKSWWFFSSFSHFDINFILPIWEHPFQAQSCPQHRKKTVFWKLEDETEKSILWRTEKFHNFTISIIMNKMEKLFLNYQRAHHICRMQKLQMCAFRWYFLLSILLACPLFPFNERSRKSQLISRDALILFSFLFFQMKKRGEKLMMDIEQAHKNATHRKWRNE